MLATLWFLIKTTFLVGVFALLASLGGDIVINAYGYEIRMALGFFVLAAVIVVYLLSLLFRALRKIAATPKALQHYSDKKAYKKGMQSLTYGLSAVAAGDVRAAGHYTNKAQHLLNDDYGLVALLAGLTARLKGDERAAEKAFQSLLTRDETAFLGIRGLLQTALERNDIRYARVLARQAYAMNPRQSWIIHTLYDLELRHRDFTAAMPLLRQGVRTGTFTREAALTDEAAVALEKGEAAKAHKLSPQWLPAILAVLPQWIRDGQRRKAVRLIEKTWKSTPHPALLEHWIALAPKKAAGDAQKTMAWVEKLHAVNPDSAAANLYIAETAIRYNLNNQAGRFLDKALNIKPTMRVYQLLARLAESRSHDYKQAQGWMELTPTAAHDMTWVCMKSGRIYDQWQAFTGDDNAYFNAVEWAYPDAARDRAVMRRDPAPFFLTDDTRAAE